VLTANDGANSGTMLAGTSVVGAITINAGALRGARMRRGSTLAYQCKSWRTSKPFSARQCRLYSPASLNRTQPESTSIRAHGKEHLLGRGDAQKLVIMLLARARDFVLRSERGAGFS
jgi:hypothetical protein